MMNLSLVCNMSVSPSQYHADTGPKHYPINQSINLAECVKMGYRTLSNESIKQPVIYDHFVLSTFKLSNIFFSFHFFWP